MTLLSCVQLLIRFGLNIFLYYSFPWRKRNMNIAPAQSNMKLDLHAQEVCEPYRAL